MNVATNIRRALHIFPFSIADLKLFSQVRSGHQLSKNVKNDPAELSDGILKRITTIELTIDPNFLLM